jgi:chromosomal replication initiation ATPase DnaA
MLQRDMITLADWLASRLSVNPRATLGPEQIRATALHLRDFAQRLQRHDDQIATLTEALAAERAVVARFAAQLAHANARASALRSQLDEVTAAVHVHVSLRDPRGRSAPAAPNLQLDTIVARVSDLRGVSRAEILGERRNARVVSARWLAIMLAVELRGDLSIPFIARWFGRDHTSVMHAQAMFRARLVEDPALGGDYRMLCEVLAGPHAARPGLPPPESRQPATGAVA